MTEKVFPLSPSDVEILLELDQLYKKLRVTVAGRLRNYERNRETFAKRDDASIEYITLHNLLGHYEGAYRLIMGRKLHPWEDGEGKIAIRYAVSLVGMAKGVMRWKTWEKAGELLSRALVYPENLSEGKLGGTEDNRVYYCPGRVAGVLGENSETAPYFKRVTIGTGEPADMMCHNDQPADMVLYQGPAKNKLNRTAKAKTRFYRPVDYSKQHVDDEVKIEYFAVSLSDLLIFEDDLNVRNKVHCYCLMGLGELGLGDKKKVVACFDRVLNCDPNHQNALRYRAEIA